MNKFKHIVMVGMVVYCQSCISQNQRQYKIDGLQSKHDGSRGIAKLSDGEFIVSGWTNGSAENYKQDCNGWLFRINDKGDVKWQINLENKLGTGRGAQVSGHTIDKDGTILLGLEEFRSKGWGPTTGNTCRASLNRYSADGKLIKQVFIGGAGTDVIDIIRPMSDGTYVLAGETTSPIGKSYNGWLLKVDANFDIIWNKTYGELGYERFNEMIPTNDGGFLAVGRTTGSKGQYKAWAVKVNKDGEVLWEKTYGDAVFANTIRGVVALPSGYILGGFIIQKKKDSESRDLWIARIDENGNVLWEKHLGGELEDVAYDITQLNNGVFAAAGRTKSNSSKTFNGWVIGFDENGNILWKNEHGDKEHQQTVRNIFPYKQGYMLSGRTLHIATNKQDSWIVFVDKVQP